MHESDNNLYVDQVYVQASSKANANCSISASNDDQEDCLWLADSYDTLVKN